MNLKNHPDLLADLSNTNAVILAALFMLDRNWRITDVNPALVRLIDLEQDEIVGRQLSTFFRVTASEPSWSDWPASCLKGIGS